MQNDQSVLHEQIQVILEENRAMNSKLEILKNATEKAVIRASESAAKIGNIANDSRDDATHEKETRDGFVNVKKQVDYLQAVIIPQKLFKFY